MKINKYNEVNILDFEKSNIDKFEININDKGPNAVVRYEATITLFNKDTDISINGQTISNTLYNLSYELSNKTMKNKNGSLKFPNLYYKQ